MILFGRHVSPAEKTLAFFGDDPFKERLAGAAIGGGGGKEDHSDSVLSRFRQRHADLTAGTFEKGLRHLNQNSGAVPRAGVAADGAPMGKVLEHLQPFLNDIVRAAALDVGDEADAAGIFLELRIVKALFCGEAGSIL
ncbi:MAG: hypothetical protein MPW13_15280 [Candidatus Manganitrophus sp.]|nr:hypothetical protein [Candidatus Manganitrophus sp.]